LMTRTLQLQQFFSAHFASTIVRYVTVFFFFAGYIK
jgi:hypothetical protein